MSYGVLIEDNPADAGLILEGIEEAGSNLSLHHVADLPEAVKFLQGHLADPPSLVIVDLNLPSGSGIALVEMVRRTPALSHVPVMVLSSSDRPADVSQAKLAGATTYYVKPRDLTGYLRLGQELVDFWNVDSA